MGQVRPPDSTREVSYRKLPGLAMILIVTFSVLWAAGLPAGVGQAATPSYAAWRQSIHHIPTPEAGCFTVTYPSTVWQPVHCAKLPPVPLAPPTPSTVGDGYDEVANSSAGPTIGSSTGSFPTVNGLTSEEDIAYGANSYGLQDNTNFFTTSTGYTGGSSATGWEQFVFLSSLTQGSGIFMQYWLVKHGPNCPGAYPPGGTPWFYYPGSADSASGCYANGPSMSVPPVDASDLGDLNLTGYANFAGRDEDRLCVSGNCYAVSTTDQVLDLYQNWHDSEFNVFGYCCTSRADFNSGTSITVANALEDQAGHPIATATCSIAGYTAETNNLNLGSCSSSGGRGEILFNETNPPFISSLTPTSPPNGSAITGTFITLSGEVVTSPANAVTDVQVYLRFAGNSSNICPIQNATAAGTFSCNYQVEAVPQLGRYTWNATAEGEFAGFNMTHVNSARFTFTVTADNLARIPLVTGWNLLSIPIVPANTAIGTVLASQIAGANFTAVWSYQGGKWLDATLSGGTLNGTLTAIQDGYGYWIYMTKPDNLFVIGSILPPPPATPLTYSLETGWNLLGFKPEPKVTSEQVGQYLSSINGKYDANSVWVYDNQSGTWIRADGSYTLQPGQAMWIMMTEPAALQP